MPFLMPIGIRRRAAASPGEEENNGLRRISCIKKRCALCSRARATPVAAESRYREKFAKSAPNLPGGGDKPFALRRPKAGSHFPASSTSTGTPGSTRREEEA